MVRRVGVVRKRFEKGGGHGPLGPSPKSAYDFDWFFVCKLIHEPCLGITTVIPVVTIVNSPDVTRFSQRKIHQIAQIRHFEPQK